MWKSDSVTSITRRNGQHASAMQLERRPSQTSMLKRALSFQFLNRDDDLIDRETKNYIKMRYKDVAKYVIWGSCRFEPPLKEAAENEEALKNPQENGKNQQPHDPRAVLYQADMEDEKTPYLPATINHVLRSDSEDSSSDEEVIYMTR